MGSTRNSRNQAVSIFITEPFIRFRRFSRNVKAHVASELHRDNVQKVTELYGKDWMTAERKSTNGHIGFFKTNNDIIQLS